MLIHPFDHVDIVAGQGTCGLEILEQCPDVRDGRRAAAAAAASWPASRPRSRRSRPDVRVVGVQAEGAAAYPASLAAGRAGAARRRWRRWPTASRSAARARCRSRPIQQLRRRRRHRQRGVAVPGAADAARAGQARRRAGRRRGRRRDARRPARLRDAGRGRALGRQRRPAAADAGDPARPGGGRALPVLPGPDPRRAGRAGPAARRSSPACQANVLDVVHERTSASLHLDEVEVQLQVETRGAEHAERVLAPPARTAATPVTQ